MKPWNIFIKMKKIDVDDNLKIFRSWYEKEDKICY